MIGVDLEYSKSNIDYLKLYNNHDKVLKYNLADKKIYLIGNIFDNQSIFLKKIKKILKSKKIENLLSFNGEYFLIVFYKNQNKLIFGNSDNSYIPVFYSVENNKLNLSSNILNIKQKYFKDIDFNQIACWLAFNGRSFEDKTFIKSIKVVEPGALCVYSDNKIQLKHSTCFFYKNKKISLKKNVSNISNSIKNAVNRRIKQTMGNISFGLSGGIDSRILLSSIKKNNLRRVKTHTIGDDMTYEKIIASKISKILKTDHNEVVVPKSDYYKYAIQSVKDGSFNSVFKNGIKTKYYTQIKKKDKSKYFMIANALDVLIASSFSDKKLLNLKNNNEYIRWYKKKFLLFNIKEINKLFKIKIKLKDENINLLLKQFIKKIKFNKDYVNLNDALTFETRIKRWHNYTLAQQSRISNFLIPTYDREFLKHCSNIHSKFRSGDFFRKKLLESINPKLAQIETADAFIPAWVDKEIESQFKKLIIEEENLKKELYLEGKINAPIRSKLYDTNLGDDMIFNKHFTNLYLKLRKNLEKSKFRKILNFNYIDNLISEHKKNKKDNTRKIFMIISMIISLNLISKK